MIHALGIYKAIRIIHPSGLRCKMNRREDRKDPRKTTTYGVGQLILAAAESGVEKIIVGLGGSSTNDGGCGAAAAVGVKFYDKDGKEFVPTGGTTADICKIDLSGKAEILNKVEIVTMCDIDNPMYGPTGASHIFGPQKGADEAMVLELDEGIKNLSRAITEAIGKDISEVPGTGAAGAMGAGMIAFFGSRLQMGIQTVLDTVKFDEMISDADYIITGEGKLDSQSPVSYTHLIPREASSWMRQSLRKTVC